MSDKKVEYLKVILFSGPEVFPVSGSFRYIRTHYEGYDYKLGDELDEAIVDQFVNFENYAVALNEPVQNESDIIARVNPFTFTFSEIEERPFRFLQYGYTTFAEQKNSFHGCTKQCKFWLSKVIENEVSEYFYNIGPARLKAEKFDEIFLSIRFI